MYSNMKSPYIQLVTMVNNCVDILPTPPSLSIRKLNYVVLVCCDLNVI